MGTFPFVPSLAKVQQSFFRALFLQYFLSICTIKVSWIRYNTVNALIGNIPLTNKPKYPCL